MDGIAEGRVSCSLGINNTIAHEKAATSLYIDCIVLRPHKTTWIQINPSLIKYRYITCWSVVYYYFNFVYILYKVSNNLALPKPERETTYLTKLNRSKWILSSLNFVNGHYPIIYWSGRQKDIPVLKLLVFFKFLVICIWIFIFV